MSDRPETSPLRRLLRLGTTAGRVGASIAGSKLAELTRPATGREERQVENLIRNALRIVETLGELKGAAMKVGQMISLHEGLLPAEVAAVFRTLQQQAPRVPFEVMRYEIEGALRTPVGKIFAELEEEPIAAASIGQVYRGRLHDGRRVAVKVQYPLIQEIIQADLDNLRRAFQAIFALFTSADFGPIWREIRDQLMQEIDYELEAGHIRRMTDLHAAADEIVIPGVVEEATASRVLTMEYVRGISADLACSEAYPQELRDRWGQVLFGFVARGLFGDRWLHADPNLANFAFRRDGRVVIYDFGCLKRVPEKIAGGYARSVLAVMAGRSEDVPEILRQIGFARANGQPVALDLMQPYLELLSTMLVDDPPYAFGEDTSFYQRLIDHGLSHWNEGVGLRFPEDIVFVDRTLGGLLGNLRRLRSAGPWGRIVRPYVEAAAKGNQPTAEKLPQPA